MTQQRITHQFLTSSAQLQESASKINEFLLNQKEYHFFLHPDWILPWIDTYMDSKSKLWVHILEVDGKIVGYAPFYLKFKGRFRCFALHVLGHGEEEAMEVSSEYPDIVVYEPYKLTFFDRITEQLEHLDSVEELLFKRVLSGSNILNWIGTLPAKWHIKEESIGFRFTTKVAESNSIQVNTLPSSQLRRQVRKWEKSEDKIDVRVCDDIVDAKDEYAFLVAIHSSSWKSRGKRGAFSSPEFNDFHLKFITESLKKRQLCLFSISVNSVLVASFYGWFYRGTLFYYQSGIKRRPGGQGYGSLLHYKALEIARQNGCLQYDLMHGKIGSYKKDLASKKSAMVNVTCVKGSAFLVSETKQYLKSFKTKFTRWTKV